ncbi:hypothetical protein JZ751_014801 [Albula glossodonta]|uniref:Specifically androgen-regulated gene protein n=1 Tax=Albula glossodonta TaxID=121402 RepID=A0A8T2N4T4_9TELE|nr:hypothetical protein JZ751_014801 [Albula glossodonta]
MPKSDTWPGRVAMDTMTSMDSAGSCDSVVSINSGFSDDSLEHLSAEERACLMFLEETIESLEAEEDSGLSNDEPDRLSVPGSLSTKIAHLSSSMGHSRLEDVSKYPYDDPTREAGMDHKPFSYLAPTPLLLANSGTSIGTKVGVDRTRLDTVSAPPILPISTCLTDLPPDRVDLVPRSEDISPVSGSYQEHYRVPSEENMLVIPPPTDFRDEPVEREDPLWDGRRAPSSRASLTQAEMVQLLIRAPSKKEIRSDAELTNANLSSNDTAPPSPSEALPALVLESTELKSPPAVAPKPKKLPSNIIMKTHKPSVPILDPGMSYACTSPSERFLMDPQRVRMEALRKLGLLKDDEADSGPVLSPLHSPKFQQTPPVSPASTDPPKSDTTKPSPSASPVSPTSSTIKEAQQSKLSKGGGYRERSRSDLPPINRQGPFSSSVMGVKSSALEHSGSTGEPSGQDKGLLPKASIESSLAQLRNARPRPASLGNGNDFRAIQVDTSQVGTNMATPTAVTTKAFESGDNGSRSLPAAVSHKLPRSQGISVLITPHSKSGEERREALRKLGLLKD